LISKILIMVSF